MVATDRISAFDVVLPEPIPYKGQVLNQLAEFFLKKSSSLVPNWLLSSPDPNVSYGLQCNPIPIEMVVRGYLSGHAWRVYKAGGRTLCGVKLPEHLKENDPFPSPIITPSTKAPDGLHDEDISREEILERDIISEADYSKMEKFALDLFRWGTEFARGKGLILVDTKYEFGYYKDEIYLMDEIHTPDSSRYFYSDTYTDLQSRGLAQRQLSKEFVREWLMENGFRGGEGETIPTMHSEKIYEISERYIELYEKITGLKFEKNLSSNRIKEINENILQYLENNPISF
jgi:phosphoribosylaminoimidazole-succinocarboxamide synthase